MSKLYTVAQKTNLFGRSIYTHNTQDVGFSTKQGAKLARQRAEFGSRVNDLVIWSYKSDLPLPGQGGKVYTVQQRLLVDGAPHYISVGPDTWYPTAAKATTAKRALEATGLNNLVIWSFYVDSRDATFQVDVRIGQYTITIPVLSTSQEMAEETVAEFVNEELGDGEHFL